jgi:hypothetical protein
MIPSILVNFDEEIASNEEDIYSFVRFYPNTFNARMLGSRVFSM